MAELPRCILCGARVVQLAPETRAANGRLLALATWECLGCGRRVED